MTAAYDPRKGPDRERSAGAACRSRRSHERSPRKTTTSLHAAGWNHSPVITPHRGGASVSPPPLTRLEELRILCDSGRQQLPDGRGSARIEIDKMLERKER